MSDIEAETAAGKTLKQAQGQARKKAAMILMADVGAMAVSTSLTQALFKSQTGQQMLDDLKERAHRLGVKLDAENPLSFMGPTLGKAGLPLAFLRHPFDNLDSLGQTSDNPHGKQDRIRIGEDEHGNSYYMRLPFGKPTEEMKHYTNPSETLTMLDSKMSPLAKSISEVMIGKDFQGRRVRIPTDNALMQAGQIAGHILKSQVPFDDFVALKNIMSSQTQPAGQGGDKVHMFGRDWDMDQAKLLGTATGLSVGKLSGGDAVAEMRYHNAQQQAKLSDALPDARDAMKRGDQEAAIKILTDAGQTPREVAHTLRTIMAPNAITAQRLNRFLQHGSPEDVERLQKMLQKH